MIYSVINKGILLVRGIGLGHVNRVPVLSRDKTDVSRGGEVNDRGKRMGDRYVERMTLKVGHVWFQGRLRDSGIPRIRNCLSNNRARLFAVTICIIIFHMRVYVARETSEEIRLQCQARCRKGVCVIELIFVGYCPKNWQRMAH